jgi:hypothetical protein
LTAAHLRQPVGRVPSAQFAAVCGAISLFGADHREQGKAPTARFASTTLVLESYAADFSTEAGNSALIANNEILAQPASAAK